MGRQEPNLLGEQQWRLRHGRDRRPQRRPARQRADHRGARAITAGSCRPPPSPSISASAWPTASACSGCRSAAPSAWRKALGQADPLPRRRHHLFRQGRHHRPRPVRHRLRLDPVRPRLDVHPVLRAARRLGRHLGRLARAGRPAQSRRRRGDLLVRRPADLGRRRLHPPTLADVARLRHHRRRAASASAISRPSPPSIKWFPDRRGMATGMAIMGFGGGAMIGSPLATYPDEPFRHPDLGRRVGDLRGAWRAIYFVFMMAAPSATGCRPRGGTRRLDAARQRQGDDHHRPRRT